jgi:hypothetical protein
MAAAAQIQQLKYSGSRTAAKSQFVNSKNMAIKFNVTEFFYLPTAR